MHYCSNQPIICGELVRYCLTVHDFHKNFLGVQTELMFSNSRICVKFLFCILFCFVINSESTIFFKIRFCWHYFMFLVLVLMIIFLTAWRFFVLFFAFFIFSHFYLCSVFMNFQYYYSFSLQINTLVPSFSLISFFYSNFLIILTAYCLYLFLNQFFWFSKLF